MKKYYKYISVAVIVIALCVSICFVPINATKLVPLIEKQVEQELGIKIHIEKLIFRIGPTLKVKAPVMHLMYEDGQKFGQFDNVKFYLPWSTLLKSDTVINKLYADKFIAKVNSDDKYLQKLFKTFEDKNFDEIPNITLKSYSIAYNDKTINKRFKITGQNIDLSKIPVYHNLKVKAIGEFLINDKKYLTYDLSVEPNIELPSNVKKAFDLSELTEQMEILDFHSDIIADLKLYKSISGEMQISGLVNIDNISVLDKDKRSPKSFIYLTFLGDKIGVLSNIYAALDKKVCIDGIINNSKKPSIDIKVKTDEINMSDLFQKVKLLADVSKFKGVDSIQGVLAADFCLKGDLNKIKSSGFLKITDATVQASGLDVNNINADIDFSNNVINITNAIGYVNNAPIMAKGKIDKTIDVELLMNKVELRHLCPSKYGVQSGIASVVANISGSLNNVIHKENIQIENFKAINRNNELSFSSLKVDTNKNNIAYINNLAAKFEKTEIIKLPLVKLYIEHDTIKLPETNIFMPNSCLKAKAEITGYNSDNFIFNFNLDGFINSADLKVSKAYSASYPLKLIVNGNKSVQNIVGQLLLEKPFILDEPAIVNLVSKVENNTLKIEDLAVHAFNGKFSNDLKANLKGQKKLLVTGQIDNLSSPEMKNIRVFIPQQLNITYLDTIAQLKGDLFLNGKFNKPDIVGQLTVSNLINQFLQLSVNGMTIDFNKNIAVANVPVVKLGDSSLAVNSTISTDISKELLIKSMSVKSKYINTDTLLMYKDNPVFKILPLHMKEGKFYAERALVNIYGSPIYLTALTADFSLKDNILCTKNIASEMFNGKLAGHFDFNLADETFTSKVQARGVSAAPMFDIISTHKDTVSGIMDFDTVINGNLSSKQSLNGEIKFIVHNGRMGTLGKLEHLLYAQNVIADNMLRTSLSVVTKAITLKDTGLFKYLRGDITLKDGIANIKMLQSQGPLMTLFIKGQYYPLTDYAKLVILGRLSDEVISGLGTFGEFSLNKLLVMLTGEDFGYSILPEDFDKLPQLPSRNTKEFRSVINGIIDKPSSVILFNWISYSHKSYKQKEVPTDNTKIPEFIEALPY